MISDRRLILLYELIIVALTGVTGINADSTKYTVGVHPSKKNFYEPNQDNTFKCLDGSATISLDAVNDDYCDCRDASDEPGTAACLHGRFFCRNEGYIQKFIASSWVNDGRCDCCDGSDEYNSSETCENTCESLGAMHRQELERSREIETQGAALRTQYKEEARNRREQNSQLLEQHRRDIRDKEEAVKKLEEELNADFGPSHVFLPLKGKCFSFKDLEYTYSLCPFDRAAQESTTGMQTELGRWSGWSGPPENVHSRQNYEGGLQCWNGPTRSAVVNIACGVEDKITSVTEPSKCEYVFDFITPAACPDLDPPEESNQEEQAGEQPTDSTTQETDLELEEDAPGLDDEIVPEDSKHDEL